ncbi:MAG: type II secretion system protein [Planctomycetes bacterium]|nr:type II secretion system protein [Planctomycetota bacterium]
MHRRKAFTLIELLVVIGNIRFQRPGCTAG